MRHQSISRWAFAGLTASALSLAGLAVPAHAAENSTLIAGERQEVTVALGAAFDATLSVTNTGDTAVDGVAVTFNTDWAFEQVDRYANCEYTGDRLTACVFDQTLAPGASYRLVVPYRVRADTYAPGGAYGQFVWMPAAEHTASGTPGDGAALRLTEGDRIGVGEYGGSQSVELTVTGEQGTDLAAIGDSVTGAVGRTVVAEVGVHSNGPATLDATRAGSSPGAVRVIIPAGTSLAEVPDECYEEPAGTRGTQFICETANIFKVGETTTWKLKLRIDEAVAGAAGSVEVNPDCKCERFLGDSDLSNNTAPLTLTATPAVPDTTAPVIHEVGVAANQTVASVHTFKVTATDDVKVTRVEATAVPALTFFTCSSNAVGNWGCRVYHSVGQLAEVDTVLTLRAYDAAGNVSEPMVVPVHVDNKNPKFTVSPQPNAYLPPGPATVTLEGLPDDVAKVDVLNGPAGAVLDTLTEAPWTYNWDATESSLSPTFVAVDKVGNLWTNYTYYTVDGQAPLVDSVSFASPYTENRLDLGAGWAGATGRLRASVRDRSPILRTEWWVNGVLTSTATELSWDARAITASTATVEFRVWDAVGNTTSKAFTVNIDRTPPATTVSPAQNRLIRGKSYVTSIKISDPHGLAFYNIVAPVKIAGSRTSATVASGKDGAKTIIWSVSDLLGNTAQVKRTVIVDNTAPAVAFRNAPKNNAKVAKTFSVTATASDRNGIARVEVLVNGKRVATDYRAGYAFSINPKKYGKTFTVQLRAYDRAGNVKITTKRTYRR